MVNIFAPPFRFKPYSCHNQQVQHFSTEEHDPDSSLKLTSTPSEIIKTLKAPYPHDPKYYVEVRKQESYSWNTEAEHGNCLSNTHSLYMPKRDPDVFVLNMCYV